MKKNKVLFRVILFFMFGLILTSFPVQASSIGNEWILDEAEVISEETENYLKNLNENIFPNYKIKPQLGIMVVNELPDGYTMDEYKLEQFNLYGVGTEEENCGMLFVFAINDREYGFEIGDGFEAGSLLRQDLESDFITSDMKTLLREEKYDEVILQITKYIEQIMLDEENGIYENKEKEYLLEKQRLAEEQEKQQEAIKNSFAKVLTGFISVLIAAFISTGIGKIVCSIMKRKKIESLININYKYVSFVNEDRDVLAKFILEANDSLKNIEENFLKTLYDYYVQKEVTPLRGWYEYEKRFYKLNTFQAFLNFEIVSVNDIINQVDEENRIKKEILDKNYKMIHEYIENNKKKILNPEISLSKLEANMRAYCRDGVVLSNNAIEVAFNKELKELNFRYEYDKFVEENASHIDSRYFDSSSMYDRLRHSPEYQAYYYRPGYNHSWMMPILFMHMENKREEERARIERKKREEKEAEERRKRQRAEEERRNRSSYSSFGGGFSGGHSGGGGFSGKW